MKKLFFVFFGIAAILSACSNASSADDGSETAIASSSSCESDCADSVLQELVVNYNLLDLMYIYGHQRGEIASSVDAYVGKGTAKDGKNNSGEDGCTEAYYDVCFMYNQMKDPFTRYFDPTIAKEILEDLTEPEEEMTILGADYALDNEELMISVVTEAKADAKEDELHVGDTFSMLILAFAFSEATEDTIDISMNVKRGKGKDTTNVKIHARATKAKQPTVKFHYEKTGAGDSIPVIRIREFDKKTTDVGGTYEEFVEALKKTAGSKSVILDLRDNGGGDTEHCNASAAEFLSKGDTITIDIESDVDSVLQDGSTKYIQKMDTSTVVTDKDGMAKDRYVVMLANGYSASCAELMLSAIASNKKSPIVGQLTYGKQIGQAVIAAGAINLAEDSIPDFFKIPNGLAVITSMYSYDKDWKSFQDVGIVPDYDILDRQEQMKKAVELAATRTEKRTAGYGTEPLGHFEKTAAVGNNKMPIKNLKMRYKIYR